LVDGQHHLTLRAAVAVQNNTGAPLETAIPNYAVGRDAPGFAWRRVLAPAEAVSLPLAVAHAAHLLLRPAPRNPPGSYAAGHNDGGALFEWSESVFTGSTGAASLTSGSRVKAAVVCRRKEALLRRTAAAAASPSPSLPSTLVLSTSTALPPCPALLPPPVQDSSSSSSDAAATAAGVLESTAAAAAGLAAATASLLHCPWALTVHAHPAAALRSLLPTPLDWSLRADFAAAAGSGGSSARVVQFLGNGTLEPGTCTWLPQVSAADPKLNLLRSFFFQPHGC
jgi:hypothetical protein